MSDLADRIAKRLEDEKKDYLRHAMIYLKSDQEMALGMRKAANALAWAIAIVREEAKGEKA